MQTGNFTIVRVFSMHDMVLLNTQNSINYLTHFADTPFCSHEQCVNSVGATIQVTLLKYDHLTKRFLA